MLDAHLHAERLELPDQALSRARQAGVSAFVVPSVGPESWQAIFELQQRHPDVYAAYGIHPGSAALLNDTERVDALGALRRWLKSHGPPVPRCMQAYKNRKSR